MIFSLLVIARSAVAKQPTWNSSRAAAADRIVRRACDRQAAGVAVANKRPFLNALRALCDQP
jgi:hypothetical protein